MTSQNKKCINEKEFYKLLFLLKKNRLPVSSA